MPIKIVKELITKAELSEFAHATFKELVKAVVDVEKEYMAVGGDLHADEEAIMLEDGSKQEHLWGINLYPAKPETEWIEFDSMINLRPAQENRSRGVENPKIREEIKAIVKKLIHE